MSFLPVAGARNLFARLPRRVAAVLVLGALALFAVAWAALAAALDDPPFVVPMVGRDDPTLDEELQQALDLKPDLENGRRLFHICVECHTAEGWGTADGAFPQIAGQHRAVILKQIADIRFGNRDNPRMLPYAAEDVLGGPQALSDVAAYIAALPMNPRPGTGPGDDLERGKLLYKRKCARCHIENGEGDELSFFPKIHGQHYAYLLRQLRWMKEGKRRNAYRGMLTRIRKMTDAELEAVADYVSRLMPPEERLGPVGWKNPDFAQAD